VEALQGHFPDAVTYTGGEAQEATAKREGGAFHYLHFATHGLLNDAAPLMSSIVLAQPPPDSEEDGFLTAREIFDLTWPADMVVLSACNTAQGEKRGGEGVVGLSWALFVAGAPTQVLSQWAVADESTAVMMGQFYEHLQKGQEKAAALRAAALALKNDGAHEHPYYWAPFILMGDWR
jgi:CHAT domain-containing protein